MTTLADKIEALGAAMNCLKRSMRRLPGVSMALAEPVDELDAAIASMQADTDLERIKQERDQAVEALRFYARENSWRSCGMYMSGRPNPSSAEIDKGNKARTTLASIEGTGHE